MIRFLIKKINDHPLLRNGHGIYQRTYMVASVVKGGKILSVGYNNCNRKSYKWKSRNKYSIYQGIHAEMNALLRCKKSIRGATLFVYGITHAGGVVVSSRPCKACLSASYARGIKKVVYVTKNGLVKEKLLRMGINDDIAGRTGQKTNLMLGGDFDEYC